MGPDRRPTWYLFDYGMVVSTAPQPADWARLEQVVGRDLAPPGSPYWTNRLRFDAAALSPLEYWSEAAGRPLDLQLVDTLEALDTAQWSHLDPVTLQVLRDLRDSGAPMALLSNMPLGMSHRLGRADWLEPFAHAFFSGRLGLVKPDPRVYRHVLAELGAEPQQVVFVDDSPVNIAAARELGLRTVLHTTSTDLAAELSRVRPATP
ncbi:HAD family hydrolase [Jannaschia sp. R86511]|uniref:HAD family hydrolase n=1 Tax=Jannaschia sp. R86511 TaxID=3093853 RepID=UPI0036D3105A